ncbi:Hydrolase domain protein [Candidatus Cyrtobacter comes]|uniref:Hydrolase domain protein n=1 Tax=Candidatus Cyrtobacter comes TaxID=675776 RepID=A0ABU5LAA1_9RICK|nr:metallophosphoesterase [Candidatus Cyrtobacter comes]MDZ5762835.1 Hydrolase domain protein [Candidatus Cyrtobacter comes]
MYFVFRQSLLAILLYTFLFTFIVNAHSKEIFIFSFNDLRRYSDESKNALGFAKFASGLNDYKKSLGATQDNSVVVAAGDLYQGGFLSNVSHGDIVSPFFNIIGVRLSAVGNHDLDWGLDHFKKWEKDGGFEFLSANLKSSDGSSLFKKYKILNISGYKVAFIGFTTTESAFTVPGSTLSSAGGLLFDNAAVIANELVKDIRKNHSPDYIIALTHIGALQDKVSGVVSGAEIEELSKVEGIDAIISGHTHTNVAGMLNGKAVVEAC